LKGCWFWSDVRAKLRAPRSEQLLIVEPGVLCIEVRLQNSVGLVAGVIRGSTHGLRRLGRTAWAGVGYVSAVISLIQ